MSVNPLYTKPGTELCIALYAQAVASNTWPEGCKEQKQREEPPTTLLVSLELSQQIKGTNKIVLFWSIVQYSTHKSACTWSKIFDHVVVWGKYYLSRSAKWFCEDCVVCDDSLTLGVTQTPRHVQPKSMYPIHQCKQGERQREKDNDKERMTETQRQMQKDRWRHTGRQADRQLVS